MIWHGKKLHHSSYHESDLSTSGCFDVMPWKGEALIGCPWSKITSHEFTLQCEVLIRAESCKLRTISSRLSWRSKHSCTVGDLKVSCPWSCKNKQPEADHCWSEKARLLQGIKVITHYQSLYAVLHPIMWTAAWHGMQLPLD